MTERILVNSDLMRHTMRRYDIQKTKQMIAYLQLYRTAHSLDCVWDGAAHDLFMERFRALYHNIAQSEERMQDAVDELSLSAEAFAAAEDAIKSDILALSPGTRFQA